MDEIVIRIVSFILVMALVSTASLWLGVKYSPNTNDDHRSQKYPRKVRVEKLFTVVSGFFIFVLVLSTIILFYFILIPQAKLPFPWFI
jgi:heme/copper-type cytochrome/quinol oxidase subunit 2